jgi:hypothetical protein
MKRRNHPAYWQLDVLICVMIALAVLIIRAQIAPQWEMLVDTGWAALAIAGMSFWVWVNWPALYEDQWEQRSMSKQKRSEADTSRARNLQLTPVQRRFLDTMHRHKHT